MDRVRRRLEPSGLLLHADQVYQADVVDGRLIVIGAVDTGVISNNGNSMRIHSWIWEPNARYAPHQ